jgi:hypothetical protein
MISADSSHMVNEERPMRIQPTPYIFNPTNNPNLYTPRIKRNMDDTSQTTTKKYRLSSCFSSFRLSPIQSLLFLHLFGRKLLDKLPPGNLLPNTPMTQFSTKKKTKHPIKPNGSGMIGTYDRPFVSVFD